MMQDDGVQDAEADLFFARMQSSKKDLLWSTRTRLGHCQQCAQQADVYNFLDVELAWIKPGTTVAGMPLPHLDVQLTPSLKQHLGTLMQACQPQLRFPVLLHGPPGCGVCLECSCAIACRRLLVPVHASLNFFLVFV